ncbi:MAG: HTH-type transcriptional regulator/antitoxin HipB [Colwellia sp.]|jgi:HTH-type transcriptional regulator/antitoxin HipB
MKTVKAIAQLLIAERKKKKLQQEDMRMLIGMSQQQYQRVESGNDLKLSTLLRVLDGLGLELAIVDTVRGVEKINDKEAILSKDKLLSDNYWSEKHKHLED